jgi:alkylation response protein AidB-like acyl-CoA dehydrogenase
MRFAFTDDQKLFADSLREFLAAECPAARVREVWESGDGHDAKLWGQLAEMGVLGMLAPESAGGMGASDVDVVLLAEELGRAAVPGPVLEQIAAAPYVPGAASGTPVVTLSGFDASPYVPHAKVADVIVVPDGLVDRADVTMSDLEPLDGGRTLATMVGGSVTPLDIDAALLFDRMAVLTAASLVGLSIAMVDIAGEYARQREQFGKPIGSFQAVKHLLSDALLKAEFARPAIYRAAWSVAENEPTRARDVSMAKAFASDAGRATARAALQVHGAIGYTWECDLQLYMKKAWALGAAWGDARFHRRRVADAVLGPRGG